MLWSDITAMKSAAYRLAPALKHFGANLSHKQCLDVLAQVGGFKTYEAARASLGDASLDAPPVVDLTSTQSAQAQVRTRAPAGFARWAHHQANCEFRLATMMLQQQKAFLLAPDASPAHDRLIETNGIVGNALLALREIWENTTLVSQLAAGDEVPTSLEAVELGEILQNCYGVHGRQASNGGAVMSVVPSRMRIVTCRRLLKRVLSNLTDNAVRHAQATKILLGARRRGDDCVIYVADNGCGLTDAEKERFSLHGDSEVSPTAGVKRSRGAGLGIATALFAAAQIGGWIDVTSRPGRGTCVRVTLPGPVG